MYSASHEPAEREAEAAAAALSTGAVFRIVPGAHGPSTRQRIMRRALAGAAPVPGPSVAKAPHPPAPKGEETSRPDRGAAAPEPVPQAVAAVDAVGAEAGSAAAAGGRKRKFGTIEGDRGAAAASAATARFAQLAEAQKSHEPAAKKIGDARAAVEVPAEEGAAKGKSQTVSAVGAAAAPLPDAESAKSSARTALEAAAPRTLEEINDFSRSGKADAVKAAVSGAVGAQVQGVEATYDAVGEPAAPVAAEDAVPLPAPETAPSTAAPALAAAVPPALTDEASSGQEFKAEGDALVTGGGLDQETLDKAEDGPVAEIAGEKQQLDDSADGTQEALRAREGAALSGAESSLRSEEQAARANTEAEREAALNEVVAGQGEAKAEEEKERLSVAEQMDAIYERAAESVNATLDGLVDGAARRFDEAQAQHLEAFKTNVETDLAAFKSDRYGGWTGWAKWLKDKVVSINELPEVQALYQRHRDHYLQQIDGLIADITAETQKTIDDCRKTLADAEDEISRLAEAMGNKLPADAAAKQKELSNRFRALEKEIDRKAEEVTEMLAEKREAAIAAVDAALTEIKAKNEALLDRIKALIQALVDLVGTFLELLKRIIKMGVGAYLSRLLSQAWTGVKDHLWGALKDAFKAWLDRKLEPIKSLMALPPDFMATLSRVGESFSSLFRQLLPTVLPALGVAFSLWLGEQIVKKLIPGAGALMVVIDGVKAAYGLAASLFSAAEPFFGFVMGVAQPADVPGLFAAALAQGLVAGMEGLLVFLGVDKLMRKLIGVVGRPFKALFDRVKAKGARQAQERDRRRADANRRRRDAEAQRTGERGDAEQTRQRQAQQDAQDERRRREDDERRPERNPEDRRKQEEDERRRDERDAQAKRRLDRAADVVRSVLPSADDAGEARSRAGRAASANQVSVVVVETADAWIATLSVNPKKVVKTKKDPYRRPTRYRKGVRDEAWDAALNPGSKRVHDPLTGRFMSKNSPWHMGHRPGYEFRKHRDSARQRGISRKQFLDEHNVPDKYRPELPSSNVSHKGEDLTQLYLGP